MKSNKKVFLLKDSILSSKIFKFSLNFRSDVTTIFEKNNYSFWTSINYKYTNLGLKSFFNMKQKNDKTIPNDSKILFAYKKTNSYILKTNLKSPTTFFCDDYFSSTSTTSISTSWYSPKLSKSLELISLNLKDVVQEVVHNKKVKINDLLKFKFITNKSDISSVEIIKSVNSINYIPNVIKKITTMDEDSSKFFNYKINHKNRDTSSAEIKR